MRSITCPCNHVFDANIPETIDLDSDKSQLDALADGTFMTVTCPSCGYESSRVTLTVVCQPRA
jgi:predicted nucleic-acid-binding Zn-ribbon protein